MGHGLLTLHLLRSGAGFEAVVMIIFNHFRLQILLPSPCCFMEAGFLDVSPLKKEKP